MLAAEEDAKAKASQVERVQAAFRTKVAQLLSCQRQCTCPVVRNMAELDTREVDDLYARISTLEAENDAQAAQLRAVDAERKQLHDRLETRDLEISQKDHQVAHLQDEVKQLKLTIDDKDEDIVQQKAISSDIQENLDKYKADVDDLQQQRLDAVKETHEWQIRFTECNDKLQSLRQEWEEDQDRIAELEAAKEEAQALQTELAELEDLVNSQNEDIADVKRTIHVKDQSITSLETQLQKANYRVAQLSQLNEELQQQNAAKADPDAMSTVPIISQPSTGDSLEEEMEALGEELEPEAEEHEELSFSGIATVHEQAPISPKLAVSDITSVGTDPITPHLSLSDISSVETKPISPELEISSISTVDTKPVAPSLSLSGTSSVATQPLNAEVPRPIPPRLQISGISSISTVPIAPPSPSTASSSDTYVSATQPQYIDHPRLSGLFNSDMVHNHRETVDSFSLESSTGTQTPPLRMDFSGVSFLETEPVMPISLVSRPVSSASDNMGTSYRISPFDFAGARRKRELFNISASSLFLQFLLGLFVVYLVSALRNLASDNPLGVETCAFEPGHYGRRGFVLGVFPDSWDFGVMGLGENMSRLTTRMVRGFGEWARGDGVALM